MRFATWVSNKSPAAWPRVVDVFEVVEVEEDYEDLVVTAGGSSQSLRDAIAEKEAVRQVRERVMERQVFDASVGGVALQDIANSSF